MDREKVARLLADVAAGRVPPPVALEALTAGVLGDGAGYADLGFARVDTHRALRTGDPEVVFGSGKSPEQVMTIVGSLRAAHPDRPVLVTRADPATLAAGTAAGAEVGPVTADRAGRCLAFGPLPAGCGRVVVACAGTSDLPVASEAAFTVRVHGAVADLVADVGVAGLHRVLAVRSLAAGADCLIAVAGMDGVLPSVLGGLVRVPVVAVPTSVGYGAAFGGLAPLLTMLNSCAPGVAVVNIDNGFGAGVFAARVARRAARAQSPAGDR